jgi:Mg2+ and Co2+ transporter CorA
VPLALLGVNLVLTVHRQPVPLLESFDRRLKGDSDLGELDARAFLATLLDSDITSYFRLIEELDAEVDRIDAHALRPRHDRDLLAEMAALRQRVAFVRRTLTPHWEGIRGSDAPRLAVGLALRVVVALRHPRGPAEPGDRVGREHA